MLIQLLPWVALATLSGFALTHSLWLLPLPLIIGFAAVAELHHTTRLIQLSVADDQLVAHLPDGGTTALKVLAPTRIASRWVWLRVEAANGRKWTLLLSSRAGFRNTGPDSLRQFTGWLRLNAH